MAKYKQKIQQWIFSLFLLCIKYFNLVLFWVFSLLHTYINTYMHACMHTYIDTYIHTYILTYIHTWDVSVAEWLAWLTSNCGRIGAIGSSPSNDLKPNLWGQKGFNPQRQCVYVYACIVKPDIQTIHRCSYTSIHTYKYTYIHTYIQTNNTYM